MDNGVEALVGFVGTHGDALEFIEYRSCASHKTRGAVGGVSEDGNLSFCLIPVLVTGMRAAPRLRRGKSSFSPRTWSGWIEEIK
jgi:hypothetical protein